VGDDLAVRSAGQAVGKGPADVDPEFPLSARELAQLAAPGRREPGNEKIGFLRIAFTLCRDRMGANPQQIIYT